jgi:hypothetical protein
MRALVTSLIVLTAVLTACGPAGSTPPTEQPVVQQPTVAPTELQAETAAEEDMPAHSATKAAESPLATPTAAGPADSPLPTPIPAETPLDGRRAAFPGTIVVYQQGDEQWTIYRTGYVISGDGREWQVPASQVEELFGLVESPDFWQLRAHFVPLHECPDCDRCPDCPAQKLIVYHEGEIKEVTVDYGADDLPDSLRQSLDKLHAILREET